MTVSPDTIPLAARSAVRKTNWCGPYAIATALGLSYDEVYEKAKARLRKQMIKGMYVVQMQIVLRALGHDTRWLYPARQTLRSLMDELRPNRIYIVLITGHYVVINTATWTLTCNQSGSWRSIADSKWHRCFVQRYAEIRRIEASVKAAA